jgi:hypothetical protein
VRLLVKNLGRGTPESVVREKLESLNIRVQGVMQLRSGRRDKDPAKNSPPTPHFIISVARGLRCQRCVHLPNSAVCECRWSRTRTRKAHWNISAVNASDTRSETADTSPSTSHVGAPSSPMDATPRGNSHCTVAAWYHTANYRVCIKWKEAKAAFTKQASEHSRKSDVTSQPAAPNAQRAGPLAEQSDLGEGWSHVVRGGRVVKATTSPPPQPSPVPQSVTEAPVQPITTATRERARPKKPEPKPTASPKRATGKANNKEATSVKTAAAKPSTPKLVVPFQCPTTPLEEISDLLEHLHLQTCVELTRRPLTSISFLPTRAACPRAVLKTVILFVAEYGSTP